MGKWRLIGLHSIPCARIQSTGIISGGGHGSVRSSESHSGRKAPWRSRGKSRTRRASPMGRLQAAPCATWTSDTGGALSGDVPHYPNAQLPLLIKLSHAAQDLSVQIHPTDAQALRDEPERGYPGQGRDVCDPGRRAGRRGVLGSTGWGHAADQLAAAARAATGVENLINFVPVRAGDIMYSPAGVVHAIGKGIVYCEVQQNSDITYRIYDWGRVDAQGKPRPLHLEQALAVMGEARRDTPLIRPLPLPLEGGKRTILCVCPYFAVELLDLDDTANLLRARPSMRAVVVIMVRSSCAALKRTAWCVGAVRVRSFPRRCVAPKQSPRAMLAWCWPISQICKQTSCSHSGGRAYPMLNCPTR